MKNILIISMLFLSACSTNYYANTNPYNSSAGVSTYKVSSYGYKRMYLNTNSHGYINYGISGYIK